MSFIFVDDRYDYIEKDIDYYNELLNDINNGLGSKNDLILYIIRYKNDMNNKYIKRVILNKDDELKLDDGYEVYCTYNMTKLSYYDKNMIENEVFDLYYIEGIGYYEITDYYKERHINIEKDDNLVKKCLEYEKNK